MFEITITTKKGTHVDQRIMAQTRTLLGKNKGCDFILSGWKIAQEHAYIYDTDQGLHIHDLQNNKTAVLVNEQKIQNYGPLTEDDVINIDSYRIKVKPIAKEQKNSTPDTDTVVGEQPALADTSANEVDMDLAESRHQSSHDSAVDSEANVTVTEQSQEAIQLAKQWRKKFHEALLHEMDLRRINISEMSDDKVAEMSSNLLMTVSTKFENFPSELSREDIVKQVLDEAVGLGPLEDMISQDDISEIMVNSADEIFYEKKGELYKSDITFTDDQAVLFAIERIVSPLGRRIDESSPMVDARLKDGSRVNAVIPPLALKGPSITIRKFMKEKLTSQHLVDFGSLNQAMINFIELAVKNKQNLVISGGTGSGKTTLLNVCSNFIPDNERIVTIEDAAELKLYQPNLVALEARPANQEGKGAVSIRELVKNCLRMRPDRIIVGECRSGEALDMLQAMNTGHDGSLTTAHANSPRDCISRIEVMVMMAGMDIPALAIREQISSAVDIIVQQTRFSCGSRKVTSICEVSGMENGVVQLGEIFKFQQTGHDAKGKVVGKYVATGNIPKVCEELRANGVPIDMSIFQTQD